MARVKVAEFGIIQKELALATVTIYNADGNGESTGVKATIYSGLSGTDQLENPQLLDVNGKLNVDCYIEANVMATITNISPKIERYIKKIRQSPTQFSLPVTSSSYNSVNAISSVSGAEASAAAALVSENNAKASEIQTGIDASATGSDAVTTGLNAVNAELAETNAETAQSAAESARDTTLAALDGLAFEVVKITSADSPLTATVGKFYSVDTSGGSIIINMPSINVVGEPSAIGVRKSTGDANDITVNGNGTDTIDGFVLYTISATGNVTFRADDTAGIDDWIAVASGGGSAEKKVDTFVDGVDFTAGSTTTLTLSFDPGAENAVQITFNGLVQHHSQFSTSGTALTFSSPITSGTTEVEVRYDISATFGVPNDTSVTFAKMASSALAILSDLVAGTVNKIVTADVFKSWVDANALSLSAVQTLSDASGATKTFSVPAGCKRFTANVSKLSKNDGLDCLFQLTHSGGTQITDYDSVSQGWQGASAGYATSVIGFLARTRAGASSEYSGSISFTLVDAVTNTWSANGLITDYSVGYSLAICGDVVLGGECTGIDLNPNTGAWDGGIVSVSYN